ncbi:hypothetical protein JHK82_052483 [Glycine max]|uniref:Uncharacterized protein n=1 Tax=Glycine max TaxID=3847 RepID=A0A0R0EI64_SOYBN|nr:hypothetical protein JHK86_052328 [Glycine max]KAG4914852.1 hypothetical protein JHK87_052409 [Glycine soja]KAG4926698.1 hypothetical protein JHK85_053184 [Glycine max]KAG5082331.1 hypothetical protein JHK84_052369 [Glycine max]KAG5085086.1 hypothetical protein JHK82_052483 [Glycine max]
MVIFSSRHAPVQKLWLCCIQTQKPPCTHLKTPQSLETHEGNPFASCSVSLPSLHSLTCCICSSLRLPLLSRHPP